MTCIGHAGVGKLLLVMMLLLMVIVRNKIVEIVISPRASSQFSQLQP